MKLLGLAFSDLHINDWSKFNDYGKRTRNHFLVLQHLVYKAKEAHCDLFFCGDLFHKPDSISPELLTLTMEEFKGLSDSGVNLYGIMGNHDTNMVSQMSKAPSSPSNWLKSLSHAFPWVHEVNHEALMITSEIALVGIPYIDHNKGISEALLRLSKIAKDKGAKKKILLLHSDFPGAEDNDGREVSSVENLDKSMLSGFDLVLMGHIHKPQKLSQNIVMLGCTHQLRRTDKDAKLGYWEIYEDLSVKFIELNLPTLGKFIDVHTREDINTEDGNYYTVVPNIDKKIGHPMGAFSINKKSSKSFIIRKYLRYTNERTRDNIKLLKGLL